MSLLTDNIIPGEHGKVFGTNANEEIELIEIKNNLLKVDGVIEIQINNAIFPKEFTVFTNKVISIDEVEKAVKAIGYHAIPKALI
ncbi:MAG: heavy-metal-associated domain-containing protein [Bacteroidota bacterium]